MAILSWGKCKVETCPSTDGAPSGSWKELDTPKEDTTKITPTAGSEQTATEEGGAMVDARYGKNTYQVEWDNFVKKGVDRPFEDEDGLIAGEHAIRITPEDESCEGALIERCTLRVEESFTTAEGKLLHYVGRVLKPKEGKMVKPYTKGKE